MTATVSDVCRALLKRASAVYIECPKEVADDLSACMEKAADLLEAQSAVVSQAQEVWNGLGKSRTFADALSGLGTALKALHALSEKTR